MLKVEGIIPAMVTPFDKVGELNEQALRQMTRRFISAGVHGLFCLGTNGEFYALTFEEKMRIAEIILEEAEGRVPVYVGAGCATTCETIRLIKQLEAIGVDALSVITPYFITYTQQELMDHYLNVAEATTLPIIMYNIPSRTTNTLQPHTVSKLAGVENIIGIKDSSGSFDQILQYIEKTPSDFSVLAGTDSLILSTLMAGGKGAIAATANVFPEQVVSIYESWKYGDFEKAEQAQRVLRAIRGAFQLGTLPSVLKAFLNKMGMPAGAPRLPVGALSQQAEEELDKIYKLYLEQGLIKTQEEFM